jgi:hypothetical protein
MSLLKFIGNSVNRIIFTRTFLVESEKTLVTYWHLYLLWFRGKIFAKSDRSLLPPPYISALDASFRPDTNTWFPCFEQLFANLFWSAWCIDRTPSLVQTRFRVFLDSSCQRHPFKKLMRSDISKGTVGSLGIVFPSPCLDLVLVPARDLNQRRLRRLSRN